MLSDNNIVFVFLKQVQLGWNVSTCFRSRLKTETLKKTCVNSEQGNTSHPKAKCPSCFRKQTDLGLNTGSSDLLRWTFFCGQFLSKQTCAHRKRAVPPARKGASWSHIKCQSSTAALFGREMIHIHDWGCSLTQQISTETLTHFAFLSLSINTTCCLGSSLFNSCLFFVSRAAESLVSLNYRYKHNYFLEKKRHKLLQCSPLTGNLCVLCVFLRQCFCGSNCIVLIRIIVSYSWTIGHTPS